MKKNNEGFSLVELIIVIAIMAILVGVLAPQYLKYVNNSRVSTDIQNADSIATAVNAAIADGKVTDDTTTTDNLLKAAGLSTFTFKVSGASDMNIYYTTQAGVTQITAKYNSTEYQMYPNPEQAAADTAAKTFEGYNHKLHK